MKKWKILIPSLIAISSIPLVSIVGCKGTTSTNSKEWVVQFNTNGGSHVDTILVEDGKRIADVPEEPKKDGFKFDGWFIDEKLSIPFRFSQSITKDLTIYASWQKEGNVTIRFTTDGGGTLSTDSPLTVESGTKWYELAADDKLPEAEPIDPQYTFDGWYHDETKLENTDQSEINEDWCVTARFSRPAEKGTAYIVNCPEGISLSKDEVIVGQKYETDIKADIGYTIEKSWIKSVFNGGLQIENPVISVISSQKLHLTVDNPAGNIAIIFNNQEIGYHSYICNPEREGFTITQNEIQPGQTLVGVIHSREKIDKVGAIKQITMNGEVVDPWYYSCTPSTSKPNEANLEVKKSFEITGDVLIWMDTTKVNWDSNEDFPGYIDPLPEQTPVDTALSKYCNLLKDNKKNYFNDYISYLIDHGPSSTLAPYPVEMKLWGSNLDYSVSAVSQNLIRCTHNVDLLLSVTNESYETQFQYMDIEAKNVYAYIESDTDTYGNVYQIQSCLYPFQDDFDAARTFLESHEWSITFSLFSSFSGPEVVYYDTAYVASLDDDEWSEQAFNIMRIYKQACCPHPINYLSNIVPPDPESK